MVDDEIRVDPGTGAAVLAVDDVEANLIALEAALSSINCRLVTARSGTEALSHLLVQDFAVVLLDVQMPEMDGIETARWIRNRERNKHLPIIFLTAHSHDLDVVRRAYRFGAVDFLFKPLDPDILRAKTQVFINLHERTREVAALQVQRLLHEQDKALGEATRSAEIAAERRANEQLAQRIDQLAVENQRKTEFLAMLAHEIRNPLAPIRTSVDLLRESPNLEKLPLLLDVMDRQLGHVTRLVDDLLDVSRITAGKIEMRMAQVTLDHVIELALTESSRAIEARRHAVTKLAPPSPVPVTGDVLRLVQVFSNLLSNSARYTPPGGEIEVSWGVREGRAFVSVKDNGIGISPSMIDSVFEMFVQERSTTDSTGGLGVGLGLAKQLVNLHGGSIRARSEGAGTGSLVEVSLPLGDSAALQTSSSTTESTRRRKKAERPLNAIVVDDNEDTLELTAALLSSYGHSVLVAHDAPTALELIAVHQPDVALIDIGLPGMDGAELVVALRERFPKLATRFIAMTGHARESDLLRYSAAGFSAHLVKPATAAAIIQAISQER